MEFRRVKVSRRRWRYKVVLSEIEFEYFMNNLRGCLLFRGYGSASYKRFDKILWLLKRSLRTNPFGALKKIGEKLLPKLSYSQKRYGKRMIAIPTLAYGNKRFVIMMDWIVRKQRHKTNIRGVNIKEISQLLSNVITSKRRRHRYGLLALKKAHLKRALSGRLFLRRTRHYKKKVVSVKKNFLFDLHNYVEHFVR